MKRHLWIAGLLCVGLAGCGTDAEQAETTAETTPDLSDFYEFYNRFHRDSLYQMEHIVFPLQGLPNEADSLLLARDNFYWQREDWIMHRAIDFEMSDFRRELIPLNENLVMEKIVNKKVNYGLVRRFAKSGGEWNLIYYAGVNHFQ